MPQPEVTMTQIDELRQQEREHSQIAADHQRKAARLRKLIRALTRVKRTQDGGAA